MNSKNQPRAGARDRRVATPAEVREAIGALTDAEKMRLDRIARHFVRTRPAYSPDAAIASDDLLQEAFVRTINGRRKWNKRVTFVRHLDGAMKSISGHAVAKSVRSPLRALPDDSGEVFPEPSADPEASECARIKLAPFLKLFEGDTVALEVMRLMGDGKAAPEIRRILGIDETNYASIKRRIRRRHARYVSDGS